MSEGSVKPTTLASAPSRRAGHAGPIGKSRINQSRWFDPSVGKWLSEDPSGLAAGDANLYRYCGNAPTDGIDPSGMADYGFPNSALGKNSHQPPSAPAPSAPVPAGAAAPAAPAAPMPVIPTIETSTPPSPIGQAYTIGEKISYILLQRLLQRLQDSLPRTLYLLEDEKGELASGQSMKMFRFYQEIGEAGLRGAPLGQWQRTRFLVYPDVQKYTGGWIQRSNSVFDVGWWLNGARQVRVNVDTDFCLEKTNLLLRNLNANWYWYDGIEGRDITQWWREEVQSGRRTLGTDFLVLTEWRSRGGMAR